MQIFLEYSEREICLNAKNGKPSSDHLSCQALLVSEFELQFPVLLPPLVQLPLIDESDLRKKEAKTNRQSFF